MYNVNIFVIRREVRDLYKLLDGRNGQPELELLSFQKSLLEQSLELTTFEDPQQTKTQQTEFN